MFKRNLKGQSSVEYLIVVAIALVVLIPGSYLFLNFSKGSSEQISSNQLNLVGRDIINKASEMHTLGKDSWTTIEFSLPNNFLGGYIVDGTDMYFNYSTDSSITDVSASTVVFFPVGFNISNNASQACTDECSLNLVPGMNKLKIWSRGDYVSIVKE